MKQLMKDMDRKKVKKKQNKRILDEQGQIIKASHTAHRDKIYDEKKKNNLKYTVLLFYR